MSKIKIYRDWKEGIKYETIRWVIKEREKVVKESWDVLAGWEKESNVEKEK